MRRDVGKWVMEPKGAASRKNRAEQVAEWLLLTMEGERETPPILVAAFRTEPLAQKGWKAMTAAQRRRHLLGIFHYRGVEAREPRAAQAVRAGGGGCAESGAKSGEVKVVRLGVGSFQPLRRSGESA